jgi:hypothetical protein
MASQLETWLKRRPRPAHLRCKLDNGETRDVELGSVRSWSKVAETVLTLETVVLEALGPDKTLLRATRLDDDDEHDDDEHDDSDAPGAPPPPPRGARASSYDPETERFRIYAAGISDAYKHSTNVAFGKYSDIVDSITARYDSQEKTLGHLNSMLNELAEQLAEANAVIAELQSSQNQPPPAEGLEGLVASFAQGAALGGQPPPAPNGAPNGKHHS